MTITIHKETDATRVNDTTPTEDADFTFELPANFTGNIHLAGLVGNSGANSFKWRFELPNGATGIGTMTAIRQNNPNPIQNIGNGVDLTAGGGYNLAVPITRLDFFGYIKTGETAGTCKFLWSQNTASATPTVLEAGATMTIIGETL